MDPLSALLLIPMALAAAAAGLSYARPTAADTPRPVVVLPPALVAPALRADALAHRLNRSDPSEAARAARGVLADEEPSLRLVGARFLRRSDVLADLAVATWLEEDVRVGALGALDVGDRSDALRALPSCLADPSPAVRLAAAHLAERLHDEDTLPALSQALQALVTRWADADADTLDLTIALTRAFGRLHGPPVEVALMRLAESPSSEARAVAIVSLGRIGTRRSLKALEQAASVRDPTIREAARAALAAVRFRTGEVRGGAISLARPMAGSGALSLARSAGRPR